jgi:hypothetical protein
MLFLIAKGCVGLVDI